MAVATPDPLTFTASMPTIAQLRHQEGWKERVHTPVGIWDLGYGKEAHLTPIAEYSGPLPHLNFEDARDLLHVPPLFPRGTSYS